MCYTSRDADHRPPRAPESQRPDPAQGGARDELRRHPPTVDGDDEARPVLRLAQDLAAVIPELSVGDGRHPAKCSTCATLGRDRMGAPSMTLAPRARPQLPGLDGVRGIAAFAVFVDHV